MLELVHYILSQLVQDPDSLKLTTEESKKELTIFVEIPEEERGLIIGRNGVNIKAIRTLASIIARREEKMVYIKIVD